MSYKTSAGHKHTQSTPSTTWVVTHNLGVNAPAVDCWIDIAGTVHKVLPVSVVVDSTAQVTITFSSAQAGVAYVA